MLYLEESGHIQLQLQFALLHGSLHVDNINNMLTFVKIVSRCFTETQDLSPNEQHWQGNPLL